MGHHDADDPIVRAGVDPLLAFPKVLLDDSRFVDLDEIGDAASGVVSDGSNDLDITIDIGNDVPEADARTCLASDRL